MVGVITFIATGLIVFYGLGKTDSRKHTKGLEYLFDNPFFFAIICLVPALIAVAFLLYFRNRNYIVGYRFDHQNKLLILEYRGLRKKSLSNIEVGFGAFTTKPFQERKVLANQQLKGTSIIVADKNLKLDFVTNNFIWEKQPRERVAFWRSWGCGLIYEE